MILYLTYNEAPSGIFSSQIVDVVKFINSNFDKKVRLLAFISLRNYSVNKKNIKAQLAGAIVLPMYPKMQNWKKNRFLLGLACSFYKPEKIIARSVIATELALLMRDKKKCNKVVYDGRGAIEAEWHEYKVVTNDQLLKNISSYEKEVIIRSDSRIAVSNALIDLWKKNYAYSETKHVIIPCTLNTVFEDIKITNESIFQKRAELGLDENDVVFIYSGSVAGWQSFEVLFSFIQPILKRNSSNKIVFFSPSDKNIDTLQKLFPMQVIRKYLATNQVAAYLPSGDYGLLIREISVTNQVASPVKYAEYLAAGLKIIISESLGDYTKLSQQKDWGCVFTDFNSNSLKPILSEKQKISEEAIRFFSKHNYKEQYQQIISA